MKVRMPGRKKKSTPITARDVLREQLSIAYDLHPGYLMPASIEAALEDAGFLIMSADQLAAETELAFQAGADAERDL